MNRPIRYPTADLRDRLWRKDNRKVSRRVFGYTGPRTLNDWISILGGIRDGFEPKRIALYFFLPQICFDVILYLWDSLDSMQWDIESLLVGIGFTISLVEGYLVFWLPVCLAWWVLTNLAERKSGKENSS